MKIIAALILLFIISVCCNHKKQSPAEIVVEPPSKNSPENPIDISKPPIRPEPGPRIIIDIKGDNRIYIDEKEIQPALLDTLLRNEIDQKRSNSADTVTVVLSVDTATSYGIVFQVMRSAKKIPNTKVVANVNTNK